MKTGFFKAGFSIKLLFDFSGIFGNILTDFFSTATKLFLAGMVTIGLEMTFEVEVEGFEVFFFDALKEILVKNL